MDAVKETATPPPWNERRERIVLVGLGVVTAAVITATLGILGGDIALVCKDLLSARYLVFGGMALVLGFIGFRAMLSKREDKAGEIEMMLDEDQLQIFDPEKQVWRTPTDST